MKYIFGSFIVWILMRRRLSTYADLAMTAATPVKAANNGK